MDGTAKQVGSLEAALAPLFVCKWCAGEVEVLCISEGLCRLFGMDRGQLLGDLRPSLKQRIHPDDFERVVRCLERCRQRTDKYQQICCRVLLPGRREYMWLLIGIVGHLATDSTVIFYVSIMDMRAEKAEPEGQSPAFVHTNILLGQILATTQTAIFWKDADRRFLGANKAFLDYYGFPSEQVILGKTDEEMGWHEEDIPFREDELSVLRTGQPTYRVRGKCRGHGEMRDIVASKSALVVDGKIVGLVGSFEDVTEECRRQQEVIELNDQLRQALDEAESSNRAKSLFLSNVSHDMRTPLSGILGIAELAMKSDDIGKIKDYLQKILVSGALLRDLINDTLELSRIANGKRELDFEVVRADSFLDSLLTTIKSAAAQNKVNFHADLQLAELGYVRLDRLKLYKVLLNLLSNAVKFTLAGGDVWFTGRVVSAEHDGRRTCRFTVRDNGIGMAKDFLPRMFEPFEQENALSSLGRAGTGLGLSIAKQLLDILSGTIEVESQKGKGTSITVEVDLELAAVEEDEDGKVSFSRELLNGRHILVCEDNELNQEIITTILKMNHMTVACAANGEEGVKEFSRSGEDSFDAVLMDIRMPVMDGLEATRRIRGLSRTDAKNIPIIALSANAFPENIAQSKAAGMNDYLTKPIESEVLLNRLAYNIEIYGRQKGKG